MKTIILKELRNKAGLKSGEMAKQLGLKPNCYSMIENGS